MEKLIDRQVPAAALFSGPYYFAEQLGFRKIIDTTFMIASMITGDPDPEDVRKYFRYVARSATSTCVPSFTPTTTPRNSRAASSAKSTRDAGGRASASCSSLIRVKCSKSFKWIAEHEIFKRDEMGSGRYEEACISSELTEEIGL